MLVSQTFGANGGMIHNTIPVYVSQSEIAKAHGFLDITIVVPMNLVGYKLDSPTTIAKSFYFLRNCCTLTAAVLSNLILAISLALGYNDSSSECSVQVQVLHCNRRNLGYSSAEGMSSIAKTGTKAEVILGIE